MPQHKVELHEEAAAPHPLELHAEHPEREHVEQDVEDSRVQEHVRNELPHVQTSEHVCGTQTERQRDRRRDSETGTYSDDVRDRAP